MTTTSSWLQNAILAAATIGSFSWNAVVDAYWLASALWYSSLILSILGILLAAQQVAVLQLLGKPPTQADGADPSDKADVRRFLPLILTEVRRQRPRGSRTGADPSDCDGDPIGEWRPRWKMVFIWQCPSMFLSYSVCFYLAGLTLFVCTPLIRRDKWNTASNVSVSRVVGAASLTGAAGGSGLLGDYSLRWCGFHVCVVLDLSLCGSRPRVSRGRGVGDGR